VSIEGELDGVLWLSRVLAGVHRTYLRNLRALASRGDQLSPADQAMVNIMLRNEEERIAWEETPRE
jgi:hypothetical protein